jgi:hypothetical protein
VPLRRSILQSTLQQKYRSAGEYNPQRDRSPEKGLHRLRPIALLFNIPCLDNCAYIPITSARLRQKSISPLPVASFDRLACLRRPIALLRLFTNTHKANITKSRCIG